MYNILSCKGFGQGASYVAQGGCIKARLGIVILFFLIAIIRKWGGEEIGIEYNFWSSLAFGILGYIIITAIFGSFKISLILGIVLALIGGYGAGYFFGGSDGGE